MNFLPVCDQQTFQKTQAFDWLLKAGKLLETKKIAPVVQEEGRIEVHSLGFWQNFYKQHEQFLAVFPMLHDHPIIQRILWEIERARQVTEFCKIQKQNQKSLAGKMLSEKFHNYIAFKSKHQREKLQRMLEQAEETKVDLNEEVNSLNMWLKDYDKYTKMFNEGTLYSQNKYETLKTIARNIYLSPLDYDEIYFEINKKLDIADSIRHDLKACTEENAY